MQDSGITSFPSESKPKLKVFLADDSSDYLGTGKAKRWCEFMKNPRHADLIVVAAASDIDTRRDHLWLQTLAIIVALGKRVLAREHWELPWPNTSDHVIKHQAVAQFGKV